MKKVMLEMFSIQEIESEIASEASDFLTKY